MQSSFQPTIWPNPLLKLPPPEAMAALLENPAESERFAKVLIEREKLIELEKLNPFSYGYEPPQWIEARRRMLTASEQLILGGNRSTKSTFASKEVVRCLLSGQNKRVACFHTSESSSRDIQQGYVYQMLPPEMRDLGKPTKSRVTNVCYTQKNGFTEKTFVLPNRSQCFFHNYGQFRNNPNEFEGGEFDLVWLDEPLPFELLATLRHRVTSRKGKLLITFTPRDGYDYVVRDFLSKARLVESYPYDYDLIDRRRTQVPGYALPMDSPLVHGCPAGHMPYLMEANGGRKSIVYFWTAWNPYHPLTETVEKVQSESRSNQLMRLYGHATKMSGNHFPKFDNAVHVIAKTRVPPTGTNYMVMDPAGSRNPFMLWARAAEDGCLYVYREWPDCEFYGEWVTSDGKIGQAQRSDAGKGIAETANLIRVIEAANGEVVFRRGIDKKAGATPAADSGRSLVDLYAELPEPMVFERARTENEIANDIVKINDYLAYNINDPITAINQPKLYISEACGNLAFCMHNWQLDDGLKSPHKDPIDCLRELVGMEPVWIDPKLPSYASGSGW